MLPIFFAQDVIERLGLPFIRSQKTICDPSKYQSRCELVRLLTAANPHEMCVIWHQAIRRTKQIIPDKHVQHGLAEPCMKQLVKPSRRAAVDAHHPMNAGESAIKLRTQPRQMSAR